MYQCENDAYHDVDAPWDACQEDEGGHEDAGHGDAQVAVQLALDYLEKITQPLQFSIFEWYTCFLATFFMASSSLIFLYNKPLFQT